MGSPSTGEIYEGALRDEGDVPLNREQAEWLKSLSVQSRKVELEQLKAQLLNTDKVEPKATESPLLGLATTGQLLDELKARAELGGYVNYRTIDGD
jgi:hypothetical protein